MGRQSRRIRKRIRSELVLGHPWAGSSAVECPPCTREKAKQASLGRGSESLPVHFYSPRETVSSSDYLAPYQMNKKAFGKTGASVSEVGMGTYYDDPWIIMAMLGRMGGSESKIEALKTGMDGGINLIDTAEGYRSEPLVAKAIQGRKREDLFVATKVWKSHLHREALIHALDQSLKHLNLSYVDLYQIHWPNPRIPIAETMAAMEEMKDKGKIRSIGVSNFSVQQVVDANAALKKSEVVSNQVDYSLANRSIEADLLPYCDKNGVTVLAYFPLGHGKLAKAEPRMHDVCEKYGKTPAQVALNWLASKPNVIPIPRASRASHVKENLGASGWELSQDDKSQLEKIFQ